MNRVNVFLIVVALITGMVGCDQSQSEYTHMVAAGAEIELAKWFLF